MASQSDFQKLSPGGIIELYTLDLVPLGGALERFYSGTNEFNANVVFQGITYIALPIDVEGFETSASGSNPRPKLKVGNIGGLISVYNRTYQDLTGVKVTRIRAFVEQLDAVNFVGGNVNADPNIVFPIDRYIVDRKTTETRIFSEYELASAWDVVEFLPRRPVLQNACFWGYRSTECGYAGGAVADVFDQPTTVLAQDQCSKRLTGCELRFGENNPLPFGGFPGVGLGT
jgi:lambda family phage minor tail protein L